MKKELIMPIVFSVLFIVVVVLYASVYFWIGIPLIAKIIIYITVAALVVVMIYLLRERSREIDKEKEDDFSKY